MNEFQGSWVRRGGVLVPVPPPQEPKITCRVCGEPSPVGLCRPCRDSAQARVHGSHAGFNQHARRFEDPCQACADAERVYNTKRRTAQRRRLSDIDRIWCEKDAIKWSWRAAERARLTSS